MSDQDFAEDAEPSKPDLEHLTEKELADLRDKTDDEKLLAAISEEMSSRWQEWISNRPNKTSYITPRAWG